METYDSHYFYEPGPVKMPTTEQMERQGMKVSFAAQILVGEYKEQWTVQL